MISDRIALHLVKLPLQIALLRANQIARISSDFKMGVKTNILAYLLVLRKSNFQWARLRPISPETVPNIVVLIAHNTRIILFPSAKKMQNGILIFQAHL